MSQSWRNPAELGCPLCLNTPEHRHPVTKEEFWTLLMNFWTYVGDPVTDESLANGASRRLPCECSSCGEIRNFRFGLDNAKKYMYNKIQQNASSDASHVS